MTVNGVTEMAREITDFEQQTDEWYFAHYGRFSGSEFHTFLGDSKTKEDMLWEKIGERRWDDSDVEIFTNQYTERGKVLEHEARRLYSAAYDVNVREVGLVEEDGEFDTWAICSPDGLVGDDGIIEIKCLIAKNFLQFTDKASKRYEYIEPKYKTQVQYNLFVTGRKWCDFIYYHPRGGMHVIHIERDEEYIEKIKTALRECIKFIEERL